jgi:ABC-2 type transport system permease protein
VIRLLPGSGSPPSAWMVSRVARREIVVRLRSRVFTATTVILVVIAAGGILVASTVLGGTASQPAGEPETAVGFSGGSQALEASFREVATALGQSVAVTDVADAAIGRSQVGAGTLGMAVSGSATAPVAVVSEDVPAMVEIALDAAAQEARLAAAGLTPSAITGVMAGVPFETVQPSGSSSTGSGQGAFSGLAVAILLFVSIIGYGSLVAQGVVEEKATRIIEILLAAIRPAELLAGKILGIGFVGLLQLGIVAIAALVAASLVHAISIPALGVVEVALYLAWFLLGFGLYASAFAAVGALVSRPEEVQGATAPVTVVLVVSYVLMFFALPDPAGTMSTVLSILPPSAPIFMPMRIAAGAAVPWQVALAMLLTAAALVGMVWLAGRVYANSAMRIGARVRFMDAFRG